MRFHGRVQAHGVVKTRLNVARAVRCRAVVFRDAHLQGLDGALKVGAHRHAENAEKIRRSRRHTDLRARADHHGADVKRAARTVGRNPGGIGAHHFFHGMHETLHRVGGHLKAGR